MRLLKEWIFMFNRNMLTTISKKYLYSQIIFNPLHNSWVLYLKSSQIYIISIMYLQYK